MKASDIQWSANQMNHPCPFVDLQNDTGDSSGLHTTVQFSANQLNKSGPYRTLQAGPAYSSGLH